MKGMRLQVMFESVPVAFAPVPSPSVRRPFQPAGEAKTRKGLLLFRDVYSPYLCAELLSIRDRNTEVPSKLPLIIVVLIKGSLEGTSVLRTIADTS